MYNSLRKKFAKQVAGFERAEDFEWRKWLNKPQLHDYPVDTFIVHMVNTDIFNQWMEKPSFQSTKIYLPEAEVLPEIKKAFAKKPKTNAVFFGMGTTDIRQINLKDVESIFGKKSDDAKINKNPVKLREVKWKINTPVIEDRLYELKPKVYNLDLLKSNSFTKEAHKKNNERVAFDTLSSSPRIFKVKILGIDTIKVDKIYFIKNIFIKDTELDEE
jgi:hypothetical protein